MHWPSSMPNTTRRNSAAVALYDVDGRPLRPDQGLGGAFDQVLTGLGQDLMVTSSGMRPPPIRLRTKSKSVCDAEGKPTSISL